MPSDYFAGNYSLESGGARDADNYPLTQNVTVVTGTNNTMSVFQVCLQALC